MSASISNSNSEIAVTNNLGFGILLDDNTVSTSLQMYMLREHAKMLAFRSIGHQFSTEIVDQVAMVLYELSKQRIVNRSNLSFEISADEWDLLQGLNVPCSERWRALRDRMDTLGMRMTLFTVSRPGSRDDGYAALIWQIQSIPEATFHTFRSGKFEAGSPNVSYRNKFRTNNNGRVKVKSWSTKNSLPGFATQVASWRPSGRMSALIPSLMDKTPIDEVENVIQYDNLLEAAAHWNTDAAKKFADLLELDVPLKPSLINYQKIIDAPFVHKEASIVGPVIPRVKIRGVECILLLILVCQICLFLRLL